MQFTDRYQAGRRLAQMLAKYRHETGIVLGIPRGGIPVAYEIAKALHWPMEIILSKKIGHPANHEYAIGAAGLEDRIVHPEAGITPEYIESETRRVRIRLREMLQLYMGKRTLSPLKDRVVIVTDDGIATGNTLLMTLQLLRKEHPKKIIIAAPVASEQAYRNLTPLADEMAVLHHTNDFSGVGQFYENFEPTSDEEVRSLLEQNLREHQ